MVSYHSGDWTFSSFRIEEFKNNAGRFCSLVYLDLFSIVCRIFIYKVGNKKPGTCKKPSLPFKRSVAAALNNTGHPGLNTSKVIL